MRSAARCRTRRWCPRRRSTRRRTSPGAAPRPRHSRTNANRSPWKLDCHWSGPLSAPADTLETTTSRPPRPSAAVSTKPVTASWSETSTRRGDDRAAGGVQLVGERLQRLDAACAQREIAALRGQLLGDRAADAAARSGDDGLAAGQLQIHDRPLVGVTGWVPAPTGRSPSRVRRPTPPTRGRCPQAAEGRVGEGRRAVAGLDVDDRAAAGRGRPGDEVAGRRMGPRRAVARRAEHLVVRLAERRRPARRRAAAGRRRPRTPGSSTARRDRAKSWMPAHTG